ncbi:hypothetical protein ACT453_38235, partial [Bacillus sp. D-CC]
FRPINTVATTVITTSNTTTMIQVNIPSSPSLQPFYNIILFISQHISSFYYSYEANWKTIITIPIHM